jgi:hypothetical protein
MSTFCGSAGLQSGCRVGLLAHTSNAGVDAGGTAGPETGPAKIP